MSKTVCFDFDGVIHSYTSGWQGAANIPDTPVPGIGEEITRIRKAGYKVIIQSVRCSTEAGESAVYAWLLTNQIYSDGVVSKKPPAVAYIDDRAICFDGNPEGLLEKIESFKPWHKRGAKHE